MPRFKLKPDPLGVPRNPLAVYLLLLCFVSGVGMVTGNTTARAVEDGVDPLVAFTWGMILLLGSAATLLGMYWPGDIRAGLLMKRTGMFCVGVAAVIYGFVVGISVGTGGLLAGGTIVGFGVACFAQFNIINHRIQSIIHITKVERSDP
jgi:hypothetical protein